MARWGRIAMVAALLAAPAALAASTTQTYETPGTWPIGLSCAGCLGRNIGGVDFGETRARPQLVEVADASGAAVGFTVCQDFDRDGNCGETNEPLVHACGGAADLTLSLRLFRPDFVTTVFLSALQPGCGGATSGTVTLYTW